MKTAAYFEINDLILYGKYKNKKGRIVGFEMDEKGQPVVEIEPVPKGQKKNQKITLFKIRKAPSPEKVASRYAVLIRQKGTCRFCNRLQKTPNGLLAIHGYNRPGYGYIQGKCPGSQHSPWEVSPITGELARDLFGQQVNSISESIHKLATTDVLVVRSVSDWEKTKTYLKSEVGSDRWALLVKEQENRLKSDLKRAQGGYEMYKHLVDNWKPGEVIEVSELQVQRDKQERQQTVRTKRLERYEGLKAKVLDRLTKTWNNLKQREAKARAKPTAKNFIEVAKAANVIYQIYEGMTKLAEAHPDPGFRSVDVLEELQMDPIWKYMGAMEGSVYKTPKAIHELTRHTYSGSLGWNMDYPSLQDYSKTPDVSKDWRPNWPGFKALV